MKPVLENRALVTAARLLVGTIFLFAAIEKAADPAAFAVLIDNYRVLPHSVNLIVATFLPWLEIVTGLALILGTAFRGASALIAGMTFVFTAAVVSGILRNLDISCGCYTLDPQVSHIGWRKVLENAGIIALTVYLIYARDDGWTLTGRSGSRVPD